MPPVLEDVLAEGRFSVEKFVECFPVLADAEGGVASLRTALMRLAVRGNLTDPLKGEGNGDTLLRDLRMRRQALLASKAIRGGPIVPPDPSEFLFKLPHHWVWTRFGEIGDWGAGATPGRGNPAYYGGEMPWLKSGELNDGYISCSEETVTQKALEECSLRLNSPGDVLVAMYGATIGKTAILTVSATTNQAVCACTCFPEIYNRYLLLVLRAFKSVFIGQGAGGAQPNISKEKIVATPFPLPPLAEQKRIVARVDQLMALIDDLESRQTKKRALSARFTKASLDALTTAEGPDEFDKAWKRVVENFPTLIDRAEKVAELRGAILSLAISGSLNGGTLRADFAATPGAPFALPRAWKWRLLKELGATQTGSTPSTKESTLWGGDTPFVAPGDIDEPVIRPTAKSLSRAGAIQARIVPANSVLMVCIGGSLGKVGLTREPITCNQQINVITPGAEVDSSFLAIVLRSPYFKAQAWARALQGTLPIINKSRWEQIPVPVPPLTEQKRIVAKVDQLMSLCAELEGKLLRAADRASKLVGVVVQGIVV